MQKKMLAACTAFCALAALMVGCTDVSGNGDSQTPVNMTAETTASEEAAETQPAETERTPKPLTRQLPEKLPTPQKPLPHSPQRQPPLRGQSGIPA